MPSTTEKSETSKKAKLKISKRLSRKRSPTNYESNPTESPQQHHSSKNHRNKKNSSQKRKNIAEKLMSDLSPKYIGFNATMEGKRRSRSQIMTTPQKMSNLIENEGVFTNSYVKMTPKNTKNDNISTPTTEDDNVSTDFESPIEKLIKKNNKELSNLKSSPLLSDVEDNINFKNDTPKKTAVSSETNLGNGNILEQKSDKLDLLSNDNEISKNSSTKTTNKLSIRKNRLLKQMSIKKNNKLKNSTKLVPFKNPNNMDDKKHVIESERQLEILNFRNAPSNMLSPQVVLHKSPQIERMHHKQMRNNRNTKIFQSVQMLSEMTNTESVEETNDDTVENKTDDKQNSSTEFPNLTKVSTELNADKQCFVAIESSNVLQIENSDTKEYEISDIIELDDENVQSELQIVKNSSKSNETSILLDSENFRIELEISPELIENAKNQSGINKDDISASVQNFENISATDLRSENSIIYESPKKHIIEKPRNGIKYKSNKIDILNNTEIRKKSPIKQNNLREVDQETNTTSQILNKNKYTENSELALENILCDNEILGTVSNTDGDLEIMNISSDFDDFNIYTPSEVQSPNSDIHKNSEIISETEDIQMENINDNLFVHINSSPTIHHTTFDRVVKSGITSNEESVKMEIKTNEEKSAATENFFDEKKISNSQLLNEKTIVTAEEKNQTNVPATESQSSKEETTFENVSKIEESKQLPEIKIQPKTSYTEAFAYTLMSNARGTKSPSSADSAKGSSIDIETNFQPKFGEIFWARISKYPYWPCIVWPDPDGKTISIGKNGSRQHIRIHVKFFADNGRRSWIRKEDLMAYHGREDFERRKQEIWQQNNISKRNLSARAFLINDTKKPLWNQAVIEASLVLNEHIEKRSEKFEKILEETRELQFFEKRRKRLSMYERRSSIASTVDSEGILSSSISTAYSLVGKRDRSPTPESPAFEDVEDFKTFVKKRKIDLNTLTTVNQLRKTSSLNQLNDISGSILHLFQSDFNGFTELMTAFIQPEKEEEGRLFANLKEIWEIKLRSEASKNNSQNNNLDGEQNFKRYSKRVTTLLFRRSLPDPKRLLTSGVNKEKSDKPKRERKEIVPILQVAEDILELNKNYLFNGLKREPVCKVCLKPTNLYKCSANCQSWIHESCADLPEATTLPLKMKDKKSVQNITNNDSNASMHVTGDGSSITETNNESNINENDYPIVEPIQSLELVCKECKEKLPPICYVCKESELTNNVAESEVKETLIKCNINNCGKYYHPSCLKYWPQARLTKSKTKIERFICPSHTCQTCISDDPKGKFLKLQTCAKCILCPASYHIDSTCIPAGSKIITATELICPRHRQNKQILNTNWCFICSDGGNLVCCESCPTSFHIECLNIKKLPDAGYICEECETGRLPLYGELIWAKFGVHKWWPCITIPPPQIPKNLYRVKHNDFDFCVRFFGTNDYSWINRGRVFLYQEDDWRYSSKIRTNDKDFTKALEEANSISELIKAKNILQQNNDKKILLVPTPYKKINVNRPVPPVKLQEIDVSDELNPCNCNPDSERACDMFSRCLNRLLMIECHPKICPAGNKCNNQMFEKRLYAPIKIVRTNGKGFGLVSDELITVGTFIIEYVGEIIDDNELKRRIAQKQEEKDENYYFLTMQHGLIIDAGPKGNMARFMNHSCEPNCETQKWNVNGNTRIGLFAINDIPPNTELTFNYNLECIGDDKKPCHCGADKCAGFIGAKYKKIDKKIEILSSEISKPLKQKSKGVRRNKTSLGLANNIPISSSTATEIPKNS